MITQVLKIKITINSDNMKFSVQHLTPVIEAVTASNMDTSDQFSEDNMSNSSGERMKILLSN